MHNRLPVTVRLDQFEGPLDLLLYLIQSHELDINRVSVSKVTDQYLIYVRLMQDLDFDVASEFLLMAATLIYWKSKAVLPVFGAEGDAQSTEEDDGILNPDDLVRQLQEHQRFLAAGDELASRPLLGEDVFTREGIQLPKERVWRDMDVSELALGYQDILVRMRRRARVLRKETVSLSVKMEEFSLKLPLGKAIPMNNLIADDHNRSEKLVTFLASLELARLKKLRVYQEGVYAPIWLELISMITHQDLTLASGFEAEVPKEEAHG